MFKDIWGHQAKNKEANPNVIQPEDNAESSHFICLSELECGKSAKVVKIQGDHILIDKLEAMGIYSGVIILKKSAIPAKGPVVIEKGAMQLALGYDIAEKILVECL